MSRPALAPWLQLLRIAALPSAMSNILIGYLLANSSWQPVVPLLLLLAASACLYCAGMVLNDAFDLEVDQQQRPNRPLVCGAIAPSLAKVVGFGLLFVGPLLAALVSVFSAGLAAALALLVFLYDGPLKRTPLAPFLMGACRTLNILLGASSALALSATPVVFCYAGAIGIFVAGITLLGRREAETEQSLSKLLPGGVLLAGGILLIGITAWFAGADPNIPNQVRFLPLAIAFIAMPILRRLAIACSSASGKAVQATIITSLRSLIVFDACFALLVASGRPACSIVILSLMGLSLLLGKVSKMT